MVWLCAELVKPIGPKYPTCMPALEEPDHFMQHRHLVSQPGCTGSSIISLWPNSVQQLRRHTMYSKALKVWVGLLAQ